MEKMYFDADNCAFLGAKTHKGRIPETAVPVSPKKYADLLTAQRETEAQIVADANGKPVLSQPDPASQRELAVRMVKAEAARRISAFFPITAQVNAMRMGLADDPRFGRIDAIRAASNLIEQDLAECADPWLYPIADNPLWPEGQ